MALEANIIVKDCAKQAYGDSEQMKWEHTEPGFDDQTAKVKDETDHPAYTLEILQRPQLVQQNIANFMSKKIP